MQDNHTATGSSMQVKTCTKCGQSKEITQFSPAKGYRDGRRSHCKKCIAAMVNREQVREYGKKYRADHKEHISAYGKQYRQTPKEIERRQSAEFKNYLSEYDKKYRGIHEVRARKRNYIDAYQKSTEGRAAHLRAVHKNRAPVEIISTLTAQEWEEIQREYGNKCAYCERGDKPLEMDHFIPLTLGGNHTKDNVVPACKSCNCAKHNKLALTARQIRQLILGHT